MLSRLEVGLADEGVRVAHAVPHEVLADDPGGSGGLYSSVVGYESRGLGLTRRLRAARALDAIQRALDLEERRIDIVHAFGPAAWTVGIELARLASAGLLLELSGAGDLPIAGALATKRVGVRPVEFSVPEPVLRRALRKREHSALVHVAPWGVHTPPAPTARSSLDGVLSVAVLSEGRDQAALRAALEGLVEAARGRRELVIFAGTSDAARSTGSRGGNAGGALWSVARSLGILEQVSLVPDLEARREPILQLDMLLVPEATGRQRTLLLDAMAAGMAIVAAKDELVESLIDGQTCRQIATPTVDAWREGITRVLDDTGGALRRSAREYVRCERSASAHVAAVMTAYNAMVAAAQVGVKM